MDRMIELINERVDPDELIDLLGLSTEELTNLLYDVILVSQDKFYFLQEEDDTDNE